MMEQEQQQRNNSSDDITGTGNAKNDDHKLCTIQHDNENNKIVVVTTTTTTNDDDNNNNNDSTCNHEMIETTTTNNGSNVGSDSQNNNDSTRGQTFLNYHSRTSTSTTTNVEKKKLHSLILLQGPDNNNENNNSPINSNNNNTNQSILSNEINYIISLPLLEGENWLQLPTTATSTTKFGSSLSNNYNSNKNNRKDTNKNGNNKSNDDTSTSTSTSSWNGNHYDKNLPKILSMSSGTMSPTYSPMNNNNTSNESSWMFSSTEASVPDDSAFNCFLCFDVDGTYVTIKDMRMSSSVTNHQQHHTDVDNNDNYSDDDDESCSNANDWIVSLVRGGRRRSQHHTNKCHHHQYTINDSVCGNNTIQIQEVEEVEETLQRRQLRILYHKDMIIVRRRRRRYTPIDISSCTTNKNCNSDNTNYYYYEEFIFQHIYDNAIKLESTQPTILTGTSTTTTTDITTSTSTCSQPNEVLIHIPTQYPEQQQQQHQEQWIDNNNIEIINVDIDHIIDLSDTGPLLTQPNDEEQYEDNNKNSNNCKISTTSTSIPINNYLMLSSNSVGLHQQDVTTDTTMRTITLENEKFCPNDNSNDMTVDNDTDTNHTDNEIDNGNDDDTTVDPDEALEIIPSECDTIHIETNNNNNIADIDNPKCVQMIVSNNVDDQQEQDQQQQQTVQVSSSTNTAVDSSDKNQLLVINNNITLTDMDEIILHDEHGIDNSITNHDKNLNMIGKDSNKDEMDQSVNTTRMLLPIDVRESNNDKNINTSTVSTNLLSKSTIQRNQGLHHTQQEDKILEDTLLGNPMTGTTSVHDDDDDDDGGDNEDFATLQAVNNNVMIQQQHIQQQQQHTQNNSNKENDTNQHHDIDSMTLKEECRLQVEDASQCLLIASPNGKTVPIHMTNNNNNSNNNSNNMPEKEMDDIVKSGMCGESSGSGKTKSTTIRDDVSKVVERRLQHLEQQQQQRYDQSNEDYDDESTVDPADEEMKCNHNKTHNNNNANVAFSSSPCCIVNNNNTKNNEEMCDNNNKTTNDKASTGIVVVDMAYDNSHLQQHINTDPASDKSKVIIANALPVVEQSVEFQVVTKPLLPNDAMNDISVSPKWTRNEIKSSVRNLSTSIVNQPESELASDDGQAHLVKRVNEKETIEMKSKEVLLDPSPNQILFHLASEDVSSCNSDIVNSQLDKDHCLRSETVPQIPNSDGMMMDVMSASVQVEQVAATPEMAIVGESNQNSSNSLTTNKLCNDDLLEKEQCEITTESILHVAKRVDSTIGEKTTSPSLEHAASNEMSLTRKLVSVQCDVHQRPDPLSAEQSASSESGKVDLLQKAPCDTSDSLTKFPINLPLAEMSTHVSREETTASSALSTVDIVVGTHRSTFESKDIELLSSDKVTTTETKSESVCTSRKRRVVRRGSPIVDNDDSISLNQSTTTSINSGSTTRRKRKADDDTVSSSRTSGIHTVKKRSRIPNCNNIENEHTMLTPLKPRQTIDGAPIRILVTNLELNATEKKNLKKIGAILLNDLVDAHTATHAIITNGTVPIRRTPKLMIAFCRTPNIITFDWLTQSIKTGKALPCDNYLALNDVKAEKQYKFTLSDTIRTIQSNLVNDMYLLSGWSVYICDGVAGTKAPPIDEFQLIVEAADGVWIPNLSTTQCKDRTLIITSDPEVKKQKSNKSVIAAVQSGAVKKTVSWLFHCIMKQQLHI